MDVMVHNLEKDNKRFFKLRLYSICKLEWISTKRDRIICGIFIQKIKKKTQPPKQQENCERENGERDCDTIFVLDTYEEELW